MLVCGMCVVIYVWLSGVVNMIVVVIVCVL